MAQVGTKIHLDSNNILQGVFGAIRQIRPGTGCLWCNGLIDRVALADAAKTKAQRESERYGINSPNPAVVTFNAEVAGRVCNEFLLFYGTPRPTQRRIHEYTLLDLLSGEREQVEATMDKDCPFCSASNPHSSLGCANANAVPTVTK